MMKLPVHRIIPFSNVEGIGNRTSIFVQGCNANCLYCHNAETIPMQSDDAKYYSVEELVEVIKGNMPFIRGITVSGGEPTIYHKFLAELFEAVHELGLTCYVDTNGFFDRKNIGRLIEVTDKFLFDVKSIGASLEGLCFSDAEIDSKGLEVDHKRRFAEKEENIDNLKDLLNRGKVEEVRLVYVENFYEARKIVDRLAELIQGREGVLFKLIRVHVRGLQNERAQLLKGSIPSKDQVDSLEAYALNQGIQKVVKIY